LYLLGEGACGRVRDLPRHNLLDGVEMVLAGPHLVLKLLMPLRQRLSVLKVVGRRVGLQRGILLIQPRVQFGNLQTRRMKNKKKKKKQTTVIE
jgi:hypothetical protein